MDALHNKGTAPEGISEPFLSPHPSLTLHGFQQQEPIPYRESLRPSGLPYLPTDALYAKGTAVGPQEHESPFSIGSPPKSTPTEPKSNRKSDTPPDKGGSSS